MDTDLDNALHVTNQDKRTIRFPCNEQGLYMLEKDISPVKKTKKHTMTVGGPAQDLGISLK